MKNLSQFLNENKYDNILNLPPVESLDDGRYDGALWGHSFACNGNKYFSEIGISSIYPQKVIIVVKDGISKIENIDDYQRPKLKSLFK